MTAQSGSIIVPHDYDRCRCQQYGRCLVHCSTCHCGEAGRHVYIDGGWIWRPGA